MKKTQKVLNSCIYHIIRHKKLAHSIIYAYTHKRWMNWKDPSTYDELIQYHSVYTYDASYGKYADKYAVRKYVKACGLEDILIPLLAGPFESFDDIDFDALPKEFILKTNHASGPLHYYICRDKNQMDRKAVKAQMEAALKERFETLNCEYHYAAIPHRIIVEELLHDKTERMNDYKIVCSYGKPLAILVCSDRDQGRDYFDPDWKYLEYIKEKERSKTVPQKPKHLEEMLRAAAVLSRPFPISRIDFYDLEDQIYFGEVTLTPSSGIHNNLTAFGQSALAALVKDAIAEHKEKMTGRKITWRRTKR